MTPSLIIALIVAIAPTYDIDPNVAIAVAIVESQLNPNAIGAAGEVGLFQIMPDIAKAKGFTHEQMLLPAVNIYVGLQMLQYAKKHCIHQDDLNFLVCYNFGTKNARKVKHPSLWPYVRKVNSILRQQQMKESINEIKRSP